MALVGTVLLTGCNFAPHYSKPPVETPDAYKELPKEPSTNGITWKTAEPGDSLRRGKWWERFNDPQLNQLEDLVNVSNQSVQASLETFLGARTLIAQARSQLFPVISAAPSVTRQKQKLGAQSNSVPFTTYSLPFDATWELDVWGSIRNTVKANSLSAQAAAADLGNVQLTMQAEMAADYFQIQAQDSQKQILDDTVKAYKDSLELTDARFHTGIASDEDVAQAETQLTTIQAQDTDLGIQRAQLEHAIAMLIGRSASGFSLPFTPLKPEPPAVPVSVPSELLERRPDISGAERRVAAANAQIGVARAAYFPTVSLSSGSIGYQNSQTANLISNPNLVWAIGGTAAETIFDAGKRRAATEQSWHSFLETVATYRQTVLAAFQDVEDNLAALRILSREVHEQDLAVQASQRYMNLSTQRYKLGIDSYLNVITAQTTLLSNQRTLVNLQVEQMTDSIQLIKALGGGWDAWTQPPEAERSHKVW